MKRYILVAVMVVVVFTGSSVFAANLVWQTSKATAVSLAKSQGKKVLFFAGRETCGNCQYMKYTACESVSPPIKNLIEQYFVPWFCDVDNSTEWYPYASGLGTFGIPLICVIDPNDSDNYLDRTTGIQDLQVFYSRLSQYASSQSLLGDIDKSKKVDLVDVILAIQISAGISATDPDINADVNADRKIGLPEALYALQKIAGLR